MKIIMKKLCAIGILALSLPVNAGMIQLGDSLSSNFFPFSAIGFNSGINNRYQTLYDTSLFTNITGPIEINAISFIAGDQFDFPVTYSNTAISLSLSSSLNDASNPSIIFDENVGSDETLVFNDAISFTATELGDLFTFDLSTNFIFDPTQGADLLLDIIPTGTATGQFAGVNGGINRVFGSDNFGFFGNGITDEFGLSTILSFSEVQTPVDVPEPSSLLLIFFALTSLTIYRKKVK